MKTTRTMVLLAALLAPAAGFAQAPRPSAAAEEKLPAQVRIPDDQTWANVHMGPSSGQPILVLVPKGTVLPVVGKRGEWYAVRLAPELRKQGMPMRWYKNEDQGYIHQSALEVVQAAPAPRRSR